MSVYYPASNCAGGAIPKYSCNPCIDPEYGRIRSIALVKKSYSFTDPSNPTQWNTALVNNAAIVLWQTSGSYDGGTITELTGFGDSEFINGGTTHIVTFKDPYVNENIDFYNAIKDSTEYTMFFRTSDKIWWTGSTVTITPKLPIADDLKSVITIEATAKWTSGSLPTPYNVPDGIFNQCYVDL